MRRHFADEQRVLQALARRMRLAHPGERLAQSQQRLDELEQRMQLALQVRLRDSQARLGGSARALQAVSPLATLARGFAVITRAADGALVTSAAQVQVGEHIHARLGSGALQAQVSACLPG